MKRHGNLFEKIIDPENISRAYRKAKKGKSCLRGVRKCEKNVEGALEGVRRLLVDKTFTTGKYHEKTVFEPKKRIIYVLPFFPDRIIQHALMNVLEPIWEGLLISDTYACIKNRGVVAGSARVMEYVRRNAYCLKLDVSKFYPSIDHEILLSIIHRKIKCTDTLWLLENIIRSFPGGKNTPIGNYTSQWFGNLYLNELDQYVKHELKVLDYMRYCDDTGFFSNDKGRLRAVGDLVESFLVERLKLRLSRKDLFPTSRGVDFLGYRHFKGYVLLRKNTAKRVAKRLLTLRDKVERGKISPETGRSIVASAGGWTKWANAHNFRTKIGFDALRRWMDERCKATAVEV
jgi:hypothetical protein